jgi:hypothetical protein
VTLSDSSEPERLIASIIQEIHNTRINSPLYPTINHILDIVVGENTDKLKDGGDAMFPTYARGNRWQMRKESMRQTIPSLVRPKIIHDQSASSE